MDSIEDLSEDKGSSNKDVKLMRMWILVFLIMTSGSVTFAIAQSPAAIVHSIDGKAWVRKGKAAQPSALKQGQGLFAGEWVSCAKDCRKLIITQCKLNVPLLTGASWKQIIAINCFPNPGERGGRHKGEGVSIISPTEAERLRAGSVVLRWKPFPPQTELKISLRISLGEVIWGPETVDGRKSLYKSSSLSAAIRRAQNKSDQTPLVFSLDDGKNPTETVKFYLISIDDQKALENQLIALKNETNEILRAVGRGAVLGEYELYGEAASEFENALATARKQDTDAITLVELITLAIQANYLAYQDDRVKELCKSPTLRGSMLPEACLLTQ